MKTLSMKSAVLLTLAACLSASAQVVTPPPSQVDPIDWNIRKDPPAPIEQPQNFQVPPPRPQQQPLPSLPTLEYKSLVEKDTDGVIIKPKEPIQLAAMRRNPMLPPDYLPSIQKFLEDRQASINHLTVANLDILERIDDGAFENVDFQNRASIHSLTDLLKPLTGSNRTMCEELKQQKQMSQEQFRFNHKISMEYIRAITEERLKDKGLDKGGFAQALLIALYKQNVDEYMTTYARSMEVACSRWSDVLSGIELDATARAQAESVGKAVAAAQTMPEKLTAAKGLREGLTIDQRKLFVERAIKLWMDQQGSN